MIKVEALQSFDHAGPRRRGDRFYVTKHTAEGLERNGLARVVSTRADTKNADPSAAAGTKSSASPAARASRRQTSKPSVAGATADETVQTSATETPQESDQQAEVSPPRRRIKKQVEE